MFTERTDNLLPGLENAEPNLAERIRDTRSRNRLMNLQAGALIGWCSARMVILTDALSISEGRFVSVGMTFLGSVALTEFWDHRFVENARDNPAISVDPTTAILRARE